MPANLVSASCLEVGKTMAVKVLVSVDREAALEALQTLDALGSALLASESRWPKKLKSRYKHARRDLVNAIGLRAFTTGVADLGLFK